MGQVLLDAGRDADDVQLWAAVQFLADRLPDNDVDSIAFTRVLRTRNAIGAAANAAAATQTEASAQQRNQDAQLKLM